MDQNMIISAFEQLRKHITDQFKSLAKQMEALNINRTEQHSEQITPKVDLSELEQITAQTQMIIQAQFKLSEERLQSLGEQLQEQLSTRQNTPPALQKHLHTIEIKSSKVVIALISLGVSLLISLSCNIYQICENSRLSDNDIKYRYIKVAGEINAENLLQIETIFEYEPDKQKQRSFRKNVQQYERAIEQRARELEQAHLKEKQAEELRQEAERLKQQK